MSEASVSLVIPTYNGRDFLGATLRSAFLQGPVLGEVIVVDDASTDDTVQAAADVVRDAPVAVRFIRLERNSGGPARPINTGVSQASGRYVLVLDQDDLLQAEILAALASALEADAAATVAFSWSALVTSPRTDYVTGSVRQDVEKAGQRHDGAIRIAGPRMLHLLLKHGCFVQGYPGFLFRRPDWKLRGGVDESFQIASDYELLCWLATRGPAVCLPRIGYLRREHEGNLSRRIGRLCREVGRVQQRYLDDPRRYPREGDPRELRSRLLATAWWYRREGDFRPASQLYRLALRYGGWHPRTLLAMARLAVATWVPRQ